MCFQTLNSLPIGVITNWSCANNSSFLVNLLQTRKMAKPQFVRRAQNQCITLLAKGATPPILVFVGLTLIENFHMLRKEFRRRSTLEGIRRMCFLPRLHLFRLSSELSGHLTDLRLYLSSILNLNFSSLRRGTY